MVKNSKGGNKAKKGAAKHFKASAMKQKLRKPQGEYEILAMVTHMHGNHCTVKTSEDREMKCFIRNKFRGRNKKDNFITSGTWVLIGIRDFNSTQNAACDLLEVYKDTEKAELKTELDESIWINLLEDSEKFKDMSSDVIFDESAGQSDIVYTDFISTNEEEEQEISIDDI